MIISQTNLRVFKTTLDCSYFSGRAVYHMFVGMRRQIFLFELVYRSFWWPLGLKVHNHKYNRNSGARNIILDQSSV